MEEDYSYKMPSLEKGINRIVGFIFYYRLVLVFLSLVGIFWIIYYMYSNSAPGDRLKNAGLILTGGSVIIGIFYSIINYEHNQQKFKHDVRNSRETLTFNTACRMHELETIKHFRNIANFFTDNKELFTKNSFPEIEKLLKEQVEIRLSLIVILNYFEGISIGVLQGIMDEKFMREFFKTLFVDYFINYNEYILFMRKERKNNRIFWKFTELAQKWNSQA